MRDPDQINQSQSFSSNSSGYSKRVTNRNPSPQSTSSSLDFSVSSDIDALENEYQKILETEVPVKETSVDMGIHSKSIKSPLRKSTQHLNGTSPVQNQPYSLIQRRSPSRNTKSKSPDIHTSLKALSRQSPLKSPSPEFDEKNAKHTRINDVQVGIEDTDDEPVEIDSEESEEDLDTFRTASTTLQDKLSFSLSAMEEESGNDNIVIGLFKSLYRWIEDALSFVLFVSKSMVKQLFMALFGKGFVIRATFFGLLLSISIYIVAVLSSQVISSLKPIDDVFEHSPIPPRDLSELSNRLMSVEREVSSHSIHLKALERSSHFVDQIKNQLDELAERMTSLSGIHDSTSKSFSSELGKLESILGDVESKLSQTMSAVKNQHQIGQHLEAELATSLQNVAMLSGSIKSSNEKVEALKERIKYLEETENAECAILNLLDKHLPERLVVKFDPVTGGISTAPEFWNYLSAQLAHRNISAGPGSDLPKQTISFEDFMHINQKSFDKYLTKFFRDNDRGSYPEQSTLVTKEVFKSVLQDELAQAKKETMEALNNQDRRLKQVMVERIENAQLESRPASEPDVLINGTRTALDLLIKKSIQRHVAHAISKPDFADPASGARIIPALTSKSYNWRDGLQFADRQMLKLLGVLGFGRMKVNRPQTALNGDMTLGACWPFNGQQGQIGVALGKQMSPSDLGVVHIRADQSPDASSAPRRISLWVQLQDEVFDAKFEQISELVDQTRADDGSGRASMGLPPIPRDYVKIMTVEYDLGAGEEFQVFPVPLMIKELGLVTSKVIFRTESNWGHEEFTCVYRLRLFGSSADPVEKEGKQESIEEQDASTFLDLPPLQSNNPASGSKEEMSFGDDEFLK